MKTALVLGGGGARGLAHLGVLKVLEKENFRPDLIVGCSIGAIIGAMYAQNPHIASVEKRVRGFFTSDEFENLGVTFLQKQPDDQTGGDFLRKIARNLMKRVYLNMVISREAILKKEKLDSVLNYLIKAGDISQTQIPFACNATDLVSGQAVLFKQGDIRLAVKASSTIPGYLQPVHHDSKILVDGAVSNSLPVKFARLMGAHYIVSVDVRSQIQPLNDFRNIFDVILRANTITSAFLADENSEFSDLNIQPKVENCMWYDFSKVDELVLAGEEAAYGHLQEIKRKSQRKIKTKLWRKLFDKF